MTTEASAIASIRDARHGVVVEPGAIRFERLLPGPIERVWAYLTDSDKRGLWLASGPMEPRVGAEFELYFDHRSLSPVRAPTPERFRQYEGGHTSRHRVTRCEPPHLLAYSWGGGAEGPSEVTFELTAMGQHVRLVLTHRRLAEGEPMLSVAGGWHAHLAVLSEQLNGRSPPSFWTLFEQLEGEYEKRLGMV